MDAVVACRRVLVACVAGVADSARQGVTVTMRTQTMAQPLLQSTQTTQSDRMMKSWQTVMMDLHCWWKRLMWSDLMAVTEERQRTKTGAQTGEAHTRKI